MENQPDTTSRLLKSPFLLVRFITFIILFFVNILILIFSSWNVTAARNSGYEGPFGASFSLFNSCAFLFLGLIANADFVFPSASTSLVKFELGWTGVLSVFYFAASIIATRDGPQLMCQPGVNESVCSSSYLLVPVAWSASFLLFSYYVALMVLTTIHIQIYPNLPNVPVIHVPWFQMNQSLPIARESKKIHIDLFGAVDEKPRELDLEKQPVEDFRTKVDNWAKKRMTAFSVLSSTPQWAKKRNGTIKRGLTNPFALPTYHQPPLPTAPVSAPVPIIIEDEVEIPQVPARSEDPDRLSYWLGTSVTWEIMNPPEDARVSYRIGDGLYDVDRQGAAAPTPNHGVSYFSDTESVTTSRGERRMGLRMDEDDRKSVSSMFPHSVQPEDWNQPLKKPPFKRGLGEGWRTADNAPKARMGSR